MTGPRGGRPSAVQLESRQRAMLRMGRCGVGLVSPDEVIPEWRATFERAHALAEERISELPPGATAAMRAGCCHAAFAEALSLHMAGQLGQSDDPATSLQIIAAWRQLAKVQLQHDAAVLGHRREAIGTAAAQADDVAGLLHSGGVVEVQGEPVVVDVESPGVH